MTKPEYLAPWYYEVPKSTYEDYAAIGHSHRHTFTEDDKRLFSGARFGPGVGDIPDIGCEVIVSFGRVNGFVSYSGRYYVLGES